MTRPTNIPHLVIIALLLTSYFLLPDPARAAEPSDSAVPTGVAEQFNAAAKGAGVAQQEGEVRTVVARIINVSLSLIGIVLVGYLTYAGWLYMTATGEEEQITTAKAIIRNAIIGLILVLLAYGISRLVILGLLKASSPVR